MTSCERFVAALDTAADARDVADHGALATHVAGCLACQAELARHRKLLRGLATLRDDQVPLPASLLTDVLVAVERAATHSATRAALARRGVRSAGGVAVAATVLAAVLLLERHRPARHRGTPGAAAAP